MLGKIIYINTIRSLDLPHTVNLFTPATKWRCSGSFHVLGGLRDAVANVEAGRAHASGAEEGAHHLAAEWDEGDRIPGGRQDLHEQKEQHEENILLRQGDHENHHYHG